MAGTERGMELNRSRLRKVLRKIRNSGKVLTHKNIDSFKRLINGKGISFLDCCFIAFPEQAKVFKRLEKENPKLVAMYTQHTYVILNQDFNRCLVCKKAIRYPAEHCRSCGAKTPERIAKIRRTNELNGGYPIQRPGGVEKFNKTMLERHGVKWAPHSKKLIAKGIATHMANHNGARHWAHTEEGRNKIYETNHDPKIQAQKVERWKNTLQEKHGDNWRVENHKRLSEGRYKYYDVELGTKTYRCQGYEPVVLRWLYKSRISLKGMGLSNVSYPYIKSKTKKRAIYLPDIVLPSKNWVIEVKSMYTAGFADTEYSKVMWKELQEKSLAVSTQGQHLDVMICDNKRIILRIRDPHAMTRSKAIRLYKNSLSRSK